MNALHPAAWLYGAAVHVKNRLYDGGVLRPQRLAWPVVSVGNLSAGGSGKTPVVIALVEELTKRGIACDVLSRGYGRQSSGVRVVVPDGTAEEFGDEPLLIVRRAGVPVVVGEGRYAAGLTAERLPPFSSLGRIHILDDGFQHRKLARNFDLVLLDTEDLDDAMLPQGRLREPLSSLARADAIGVTQDLHTRYGMGEPQWRIRRTLRLDERAAKYPVVFCGIAKPRQFFRGLADLGVIAASTVAFRDHHRFTARDIGRLRQLCASTNADGFLTTEKDLLRLGELHTELEPISAVRLDASFENPQAVVSAILAACRVHA